MSGHPFADALPTVLGAAIDIVIAAVDLGQWAASHLLIAGGCMTAVTVGAVALRDYLARRAMADRIRFDLTPTRRFDPSAEEIWRYAAVLMRASGAGQWWTPQRARSVRLRLRADGTEPLGWSVEGPASARQILSGSPYDQVTVTKAPPLRDKTRTHTVRAEFTVHGNPARYLREVPLEPDPLQPVVDAVADLRADLGDLAEIVLDLQPVPRWRLKLRRWQILSQARGRAQSEARRESRQGWSNAADLEDSWRHQLSQLLEPSASENATQGRRLQLPARPRPVNREMALGRIGKDAGLVRIQLLVRCCSNTEGRAERRLRHLASALDIWADGNRLRMDGRRLGPWHLGANHRLRRGSFDKRWSSGLVVPRAESWVRIDELGGLLKPVTANCRLPLMASQVPTYELGSTDLMPHGWYTSPDGRTRLIASPLPESLFSLSVGKSTYGKTEKAVVQALALAHGGHGVTFVDPHADSWTLAAPYLAHDSIRSRVWRLDLTGRPDAAVAGWNPLGVDHGQQPDQVVRAVVDGFASVLGWNDLTAPRAMTILTKSVQALVAINVRAVASGHPDRQATLFQIRPLLGDPAWRGALLGRLEQLDPQAVRWWRDSFPALPADALPVVTNPIDRLAADPTASALLGNPVGRWDFRAAMDGQKVAWICPAGTGPTDRLLVALLTRDLFRAGLSRRDVPEHQRVEHHVFLDEFISLDGAASGTFAEIAEQLRKFGVRQHVMAQLLERLSATTRDSLLQNASVLSSTAGSLNATRLVAAEWHGAVDPGEIADLPRFHHYLTLTAGGERVGPLRIRGPQVSDVFRPLYSPRQVPDLVQGTARALDARPVGELTARAAQHDQRVLAFLTHPGPAPRDQGPDHSEGRGPDSEGDHFQ